MSPPVVLVSDPLPGVLLAELATDFDVRRCDGTDRSELLAAVPGAEALIVRSATRVDQEVLKAASRLRIVARAGVGLDNIDVGAAGRAGVLVANSPDSNVVSVAELAVGLIVALARPFADASSSVHAGEWRRADFQGVELAGRTAGIVGFGRVGQLVATRLGAFGMRIVAHDPFAREELERAGVPGLGLNEVMRRSDVLTLHVPLTDGTRDLIGDPELALARPTLHLVNTARGGIVDETALARALREGRIAGAAVDVFADEPPRDSPLIGLPNVIATPHIGAGTPQAQERAGRDAVRAVRQAFAAVPPAGAGAL
ncbi:hydroxyacid dehydrogenase [Streptomyces parvus]|uniref:hydroxyacid dehydrogenase n=1 Tax=Streptomyces parvus TaxID=66428 RepID=UPI00381ACDF4